MSGTALRFLVCGSLAALVNWLARIELSTVMSFSLAIVLAYVIGMMVGFLLYRSIVWPYTSRDWRKQFVSFVGINILGAGAVLIVSLALLQVARLLGMPNNAVVQAIAHGLAIAVGAGCNFLGHNRVTFTA